MNRVGPTFHITTASNGLQDVWLDFVGDNGKSCSLSIAAIAERSGPIVRDALRGWARRVLDHAENHAYHKPGCQYDRGECRCADISGVRKSES